MPDFSSKVENKDCERADAGWLMV